MGEDELIQARQRLAEAVDGWEQAASKAEEARRAELTAMNRLNEAQKAFDKAVAVVQTNASPRGSDWSRRNQPKFPSVG